MRRRTVCPLPVGTCPVTPARMKSIFKRIRNKFKLKDLPPPYSENDENNVPPERYGELPETNCVPAYGIVDLLANCNITSQTTDESENSDAEYAEIQDMGIWHSTPLAHRHKSKISLTWVLKENLENAKLPVKKQNDEKIKNTNKNETNRYQSLKRNNANDFVKSNSRKQGRETKERVEGRNELYHNLRFRLAYEEFGQMQESWSDTSLTTERTRRRHRHRHRRKRRHRRPRFGYDITDLDRFLSEASLQRPGNIPVVVGSPSALHGPRRPDPRRPAPRLPLGTVVNALFKEQQWLYVQTPHGDEGYVPYSACLPLGILPARSQKKTPCWESSTDVYPRPSGNLTDSEKHLRGGGAGAGRSRARSESHYRPRQTKHCAEKDFDSLYLKTKSVCSDIDKLHDKENYKEKKKIRRQTLLVVNSDYRGSALNRTLSVCKGEVVVLIERRSDVTTEWFYVRKQDGTEGYIPAAVAGHGYI